MAEWDKLRGLIDPLLTRGLSIDFFSFKKSADRLFRLWPFILEYGLAGFGPGGRLEVKALPIRAIAYAVEYLKPGIMRHCKNPNCKRFLMGWDRRDYCSKKCRPKQIIKPRPEYQKVLMAYLRLRKAGITKNAALGNLGKKPKYSGILKGIDTSNWN